MPVKLCALPTLGSSGYWRFKETIEVNIYNLHGIDTKTTPLYLVGVTSFKEVLNNSQIDPLSKIYLPYGLTELDFHNDFKNDVALVVLESRNQTNNIRVTLPVSSVVESPKLTQIPYLNTAFVIDLGDLPEGIDLTLHHEQIKEFVESLVGVNTQIKQVQFSEPVYKTVEEHEQSEQDRMASATIKDTHKSLHEKLQVSYDRLKTSYYDLVDRITNN